MPPPATKSATASHARDASPKCALKRPPFDADAHDKARRVWQATVNGGGMTRWSGDAWVGRRWAQLRRAALSPGLAVLAALALVAPGLASAQGPPPALPDGASPRHTTWLARFDAPPAAQPAALPPDEPTLRQGVQQALWPADIVRLADAYLGRFAAQPWAAEARALRQQAEPAAHLLLRPEVQLFRSAFVAAPADDPAAVDLRLAALGDRAAALRLAQPSPQMQAGSKRQLGWLQFAAALGSEQAAYALALHYRRAAQPLLAAQHEAQALALGHVPPVSLDHTRK